MPELPRIVAVVGTNASGKSSLGVRLAQRFGGEIVSADSRQVFRGLDLGSGKISPEEMRGETFVVQGDETDADVQAFLTKYHFSIRASCRVVDDLSTIAMVESGFGICILPSLILERAHGNVDAYPIEPMEYREFGIAVQNPQMLAPAVRQMAAHIEAFAAEKRAEDPQTNADFVPGEGI